MATYAMAVQTGCVVDIGAQKISVCCVDDGQILSRTVIRKHYGGDDINQLLYRLIKSE
jgi:actin-related protein 8